MKWGRVLEVVLEDGIFMLLSWFKSACMPFCWIDLQMDFWYTVGIYKMIGECEVYIYGEKKSFKKTRFVF